MDKYTKSIPTSGKEYMLQVKSAWHAEWYQGGKWAAVEEA
jgi:hypothetical protein